MTRNWPKYLHSQKKFRQKMYNVGAANCQKTPVIGRYISVIISHSRLSTR